MRLFAYQFGPCKRIIGCFRIYALIASLNMPQYGSSKIQHMIIRFVIMLKVPTCTSSSGGSAWAHLSLFGLPTNWLVPRTQRLFCFTFIDYRTGSRGTRRWSVCKSGAFSRLITFLSYIMFGKVGGRHRASAILLVRC